MHSFMHQQHPLPPPSPAPYPVVQYNPNGVHHNQHPLSQSTHVHNHSLSLQSYASPPTLQQLTQAQASARQGQPSPGPSGSNANGTIASNAHWQQQLLKAEVRLAWLTSFTSSNAHFTYSCAEQQVLHITGPVNLLWRRATLPNLPSRSPIPTRLPQNPPLQRRTATGENSLYPLSSLMAQVRQIHPPRSTSTLLRQAHRRRLPDPPRRAKWSTDHGPRWIWEECS